MARAIAANGLTLMIVLLALAAGAIAWGQRQWTAPGPLAEAICVEVEQGATMRGVSDDLAERGAVTSAAVLRMGADYTDRAEALKAGSFRVPEGASARDVLAIITEGGASTCGTEVNHRIGVTGTDLVVRALDPASNNFVEAARFVPGDEPEPVDYVAALADPDTRYRVTLAEGATSWQAREGVQAATFLSGDAGPVPAEGSLAPGSYEVEAGADRGALMARMAERQGVILAEAWEARDAGLPIESPEEALILASIVEKETAVAEERPEVAGVFVNRLRDGMRLQTDPTVIYGITRGQGTLGRGLRRSELDATTPWNTYRIDGLPPTPIANPGRAAIEAAVSPGETEALYFVADGTGGHAFAETLAEHNTNVARWRAIEAERAESQ